jgi:hypothetical protein
MVMVVIELRAFVNTRQVVRILIFKIKENKSVTIMATSHLKMRVALILRMLYISKYIHQHNIGYMIKPMALSCGESC